MKHLAKRIFKALSKDNGSVGKDIDTHIPDYTQIADEKQAKQVMKTYLEDTIAACEPKAGVSAKRAIAEAKEVLSDEKFLVQKGIRSLVDKDARVGRKSKEQSFYGYKTEFMMTADERVITAIQTSDGAYVDGTKFNELLSKTKAGALAIKEVYGDKAYFRAKILGTLKEANIAPYIPVSASAYRIDEALFSYNKDSDQWFCALGNETVSRRTCHTKRGGEERSYFIYTFAAEFCVNCPHRAACMRKATGRARWLEVSLNTAELYAVSQWQKSDDFLEKYKKRAAQEWKNAEMKRFHGLARARGFGLCSVATQAKLTAIAVNLKRIAALVAEKGGKQRAVFAAHSPWLSSFFRMSRFLQFQRRRMGHLL